MLLEALSQKKLIIFSGKGGVGKTTIACAVALRLAHMGRRVLLAELDSQEQVAALFHVPPIGYRECLLRENLHALNIIPMKAFEEYVMLQIKFHPLYTAVFDNRFVRYFIEAAPGLAELMSIGKVYSLIDSYDTIIVDAPATGHGMSLLQVPTTVASAVRIGPLKNHSEKIEQLLRDRERTALAVVTLAEEMPVAETLELAAWTRKNLAIDIGPLFVNAIYPPLFTKEERHVIEAFFEKKRGDKNLAGLKASYRMHVQRATLQQHYLDRLQKKLAGVPLQTIPYLFDDTIGQSELQAIGTLLAGSRP